MSEKKILAAIESLQQSIGQRLNQVENRLDLLESLGSQMRDEQTKQQRDITTLFEQIDELCERRPVWKSKDGREVGVRKEEAYSICDYCAYVSSGVVLRCGGSYSQSQDHGPFCLNGNNSASYSGAYIGCRLQKLP